MADTASFDLTSTGWTLVASGRTTVLLQQSGGHPVQVAVASSTPAVDAAFMLMDCEADDPTGTLSLSGLGATDKVYAKALRKDSRVAVTGSGLAATGTLDQLHADLVAPTPAGENLIGKVGGMTTEATASFTRPADTVAYASGDLVANSTAAGSVAPLSFSVGRVAGGSGMIRRVRLKKSGTGLANASFRLHLYLQQPTISNGDNGVWLTNHAGHFASFDITADKVFSDAASGGGAPNVGSEASFKLSSGQVVFGLLEARGAYAPASGETFTFTLEVLQD